MASTRFVFHPAAVAEARAFEFIARHPEGAQQTEQGVRRLVMRTYPFAIVYRLQGEQIQVVAVAHQHREPGYWKGR